MFTTSATGHSELPMHRMWAGAEPRALLWWLPMASAACQSSADVYLTAWCFGGPTSSLWSHGAAAAAIAAPGRGGARACAGVLCVCGCGTVCSLCDGAAAVLFVPCVAVLLRYCLFPVRRRCCRRRQQQQLPRHEHCIQLGSSPQPKGTGPDQCPAPGCFRVQGCSANTDGVTPVEANTVRREHKTAHVHQCNARAGCPRWHSSPQQPPVADALPG